MTGTHRRSLTAEELTIIMQLAQSGKSNSANAGKLGCGRSTVAFVGKIERASASPPNDDNCGRKMLFTACELRQLKRDMDSMRLSCVVAITENVKELRASASTRPKRGPVSPWTVRRSLRGLGFTSLVAVKNPFLSARGMSKRLEWAKARAH